MIVSADPGSDHFDGPSQPGKDYDCGPHAYGEGVDGLIDSQPRS